MISDDTRAGAGARSEARRWRRWQAVLVVALAGCWALAGGSSAFSDQAPGQDAGQDAGQDVDVDEAAELTVGVYDPEQVFTAYPRREAAMSRLQELAEQAVAAQQAGDQEGFIEAQRQMEQTRQRIIMDFERAVGEAASAVADAEGLHMVAAEVAFRDRDVATRDVTRELIEQLAEAPDAPDAPDAQGEPPTERQAEPAPAPPGPGPGPGNG